MKKSVIIAAVLGIAIGVLAVLTTQRVQGIRGAGSAKSGNWRKIELILDCIERNYVDSVDRKKLTDAMAEAAMKALDPHSMYMLPQLLKDSEEDLAGNFDGIGIQFNVPNDTAVVIEVIPGGPSEKIGLQAGDRILKVDSTTIAGVKFPQDSMVRRMKGKAGSKVLVTVKREKETIPFEITRGKIPVHSVDCAFMVGDSTAYLRLAKFSRTTFAEFGKATSSLREQGMRTLILDIRDNSGGFLDQALTLANAFLPKDAPIVYMEGEHRKRNDYKADGKGTLQDINLKVLINENSASSSEILAGALQDNGRAQIIGRRSFGKGLVQEPFYFNDGSALRMTIARFHTPSGRCIQKPYSEDYDYEVYKRYNKGEMVSADSMNVSDGGIIPDIFVAADTTKASEFFISCRMKATTMRFASAYFDSHKTELSAIDDYAALISYLDKSGLEQKFLDYAWAKDKIRPTSGTWSSEKQYLMSQVYALVGRYSKLGDNAYYHLFLDIDEVFKVAIGK